MNILLSPWGQNDRPFQGSQRFTIRELTCVEGLFVHPRLEDASSLLGGQLVWHSVSLQPVRIELQVGRAFVIWTGKPEPVSEI